MNTVQRSVRGGYYTALSYDVIHDVFVLCIFTKFEVIWFNTQGDSDEIPVPASFRRHLVGKLLVNVFTVISLKYALLAS